MKQKDFPFFNVHFRPEGQLFNTPERDFVENLNIYVHYDDVYRSYPDIPSQRQFKLVFFSLLKYTFLVKS